ncbi:MAG: SDR family oxidoreductase [Chloroflexi bacterium]|nr:SDR family oxidoreductase [Chloroflexota bacterium]MBV9601834.1 SDR family oxidoreductase [Chloroflexota bacterium]
MSHAPDLFRLDGRVALVTGGAGLLGRGYCEALVQAGAHVVIGDVDAERAHRLAAELNATSADTQAAPTSAPGAPVTQTPARDGGLGQAPAPARALGVGLDVTDPASVAQTVGAASRAFGRLDILVNNAALTVRGGSERLEPADYFAPFEDYKLDVWEQALRTNLTGMLLCAQAAGRQMLAQEPSGGVLVNISSTYGVVGPDQRLYEGVRSPYAQTGFNTPVSYAVTKTAVLGLTRYLATYWGSKHIRVNALTPHGVFDNHDEAFVRNFVYRSPLGRMARNDEYRGALLFLVSDASSYMTGANLIVDGGWTAW